MSLMASVADSRSLSMARLELDAEKFRRQTGRNTDSVEAGRDMVTIVLDNSHCWTSRRREEEEQREKPVDHEATPSFPIHPRASVCMS